MEIDIFRTRFTVFCFLLLQILLFYYHWQKILYMLNPQASTRL